ncbi:MAG: LuxR C-terminal-related transcriptional regulator [Ilumatobacteraceae bacterium]
MTASSPQASGAMTLVRHRPGVPAAAAVEIARPRLTALFDEAHPIVAVTALPGYGATTAVAQWARGCKRDVGWLRADAGDHHGQSPWAALVEAASGHLLDPAVGDGDQAAGDGDQLERLVAHVERFGGGVLVVDGLQSLAQAHDAGAVAALVERLAHHLRVVLIGHGEPPLPMAAWRAHGVVTDVGERDLAFDEAEALAAAATIAPGALAAEDVVGLNRRLAGWPIGMVLALSAIRDAPDPERARAVLVDPAHLLHDHVMIEIVGGLARRELDLALSLAVAELLDGEASRLLAGDDAPVVIDRLRRARLLSVVPDRPGLLRFNAVVREVLDRRLSWVDPARHAELHRQMAELCGDRGQLNEAHRHLLAAGQRDATSRLVMTPTVELSDVADRVGLVAMLGRLPRPQLVDDAGLAFDIALAWVFAGSARQAWVWCDRAEHLLDPHDERLVPRSHATRCVLGMLVGDLEAATRHLDSFEAMEQRAGLLPPVEGVLVSSAVRVMLASGDMPRARAWLDRARTTTTNEVFDLIVAALRAWADMLGGQLRGPLGRVQRVTAEFAERGLRPHLGHFEALVVEAWGQLGAGNFECADRCTAEALLHAELLNFDWSRARAGAVDAHVRFLRDGAAAGLAAAREVRLGLEHPVSAPLLAPIDEIEARALIRHGQFEIAAMTIDAMPASPARALALADLAIADGRPGEVATALAGFTAWPVAERITAQCLLAAATATTTGDGGAVWRLTATVEEAASLGWVSPFLGRGRQVDAVLRRTPLARLHPALATHLLADRSAPPARLFGPLTARERTVLELLPSHLTYGEIGQRLNLSVNTVKSNMKSIYRKLGVSARSAAVDAAVAHGLL